MNLNSFQWRSPKSGATLPGPSGPALSRSRFTALLVAGILALNLVAVMLVALTLYQSRQQHQKQAAVSAQNLSRLLAYDLGASFDKIDLALLNVVDEVSRLRSSGSLDAGALNAFIVRQVERLPELTGLRLTDAQGDLLYGTSLAPGAPVNVANRDFFIRLRDRPDAGLVVSKAIESRTTGKWQIALARRLNQPDDSFVGMAVALIELDKITAKFANLDVGRNGIINLYDHELAMVTRHPSLENAKPPIGQKIISRQFEEQLRIAPEAGIFHAISPLDKLDRTFSYRKITSFPFYIVVGLASADYLSEWQRDVAKNGFLMAVFALVTLGFAWLTIRAWRRREADLEVIKQQAELYAALNQCRQAILRCASEDELFLQLCRAAVQFGGMKMAWVGLLDEASQLVKPVAWYGTDTDYLKGIQISVSADEPSGRGVSGTAIRENRPVWIQDYQNEPSLALARARPGASAGWRAAAALPLIRQGKVIGSLILYAGEVNAFDEVARNLLMEMARDIDQVLDSNSLQAGRKRAEEELRESEARFRCLTEMSSDFYWESDVEHRLTQRTASRREAEESVFQQASSVGLCRWEIPSLSPDEAGWQAHRALLDAHLPFRNFEIARPRANGALHHISVSGDPVFDAAGHFKGYRGIGTDITERKRMEEQVRQLAFHDPLTLLPNRRLLNDRMSQAMAASKRSACYGALMFLDLDNFKPLNDVHGHAVGDLLLTEVAERLKNCVREIDTVARIGGDEFVVLLRDLNADKAEATSEAGSVAEKIRIALSEPYRLTIKHEGKADTILEHRCTASIGVTLFLHHEASQDDILKRADAAMYRAKEAGRNSVRFYEPMAGTTA